MDLVYAGGFLCDQISCYISEGLTHNSHSVQKQTRRIQLNGGFIRNVIAALLCKKMIIYGA